MRRGLPSITVSLLLISALFVGIDLSFNLIPTVSSASTWYVDDVPGGSPPEDFTSIQDAVNASQPGDTVFVYAGVYYENIVVNRTINLIGEDRDDTIINGSKNGHVVRITSDWVNITGFTITNSGSQALDAGINLESVNNIRIINNNISRNNYHGIYADYSNGNYIYINNNKFMNNSWGAIWFQYGPFNYGEIHNNTINYNMWGIILNGGSSTENSKFFNITNNTLIKNWRGIVFNCAHNNTVNDNKILTSESAGLLSAYYSRYNTYSNNIIESDEHGLRLDRDSYNTFVNNSISGGLFDIYFHNDYTSMITILNCSFNKSKVYYDWPDSTLTVQWYLNINVVDYLGNPVPNAQVEVEDNLNGFYNQTFLTDSSGHIKWLPLTEYIENDISGDTKGEKIYFTPHRIIAWNNTLVGYAYPEPNIDESKTVTIILYNGTLLHLESGWNLISLPRIQLDTNIQKVLQPVEGRYDSVQWYNITDNNDPWKHHHISKPPFLNDLLKLNHTKGFWIQIIDPEGTNLVVFGDELITEQNISIYIGWNLLGFPSKSNKTRDIALDTLSFGSDIDSIWTYNTSIHKWVELDDALDYFEVGKGYWIHSKVDDIWNVPL